MKNNAEAERFPCPIGCGKDFKTNSAAHAHAKHCKFEAEVEEPAGAEETTESPEVIQPELTESEMAVYNKVVSMVGDEVQQGIAALQGSVVESLLSVLPQMVETKVGDGIVAFVESLKNPQPAAEGDPGTAVAASSGNGARTTGLADFLALSDQINAFLDTTVGKLIYKKVFGGGGGASQKGNWKEWARGHSMAVGMMGSNKADPSATAIMIKEMTGPYKTKAGNDLLRGMHAAAEMFIPSQKGGTPMVETPEVKNEPKT